MKHKPPPLEQLHTNRGVSAPLERLPIKFSSLRNKCGCLIKQWSSSQMLQHCQQKIAWTFIYTVKMKIQTKTWEKKNNSNTATSWYTSDKLTRFPLMSYFHSQTNLVPCAFLRLSSVPEYFECAVHHTTPEQSKKKDQRRSLSHCSSY